jgi:RNA polymerase sigma-70 factor, ECF subfamily
MDDGQSAGNLSELIEQYYQLLYRYAFRLSGSTADAEDLTQQTFLTAQTHLHQLRDPSRAKAWLCSIVRNLYLKNVHKAGDPKSVSLEHVPEPKIDWNRDSPIDQEKLQHVLNQMPEEFRSPIILFYFEEFSYKEIAEHMDVPLGTVMSRLARAKSYLRQRLAAGRESVPKAAETSVPTARR